jgi:hypothetical protein
LDFIGLGFVFCGAIFSVTRSGHFVDGRYLIVQLKHLIQQLTGMINDLNFNGEACYVPAYSQNALIPDYLKKLHS